MQEPQRGGRKREGPRENKSVEKKRGSGEKEWGHKRGERSQGQCRVLPISAV